MYAILRKVAIALWGLCIIVGIFGSIAEKGLGVGAFMIVLGGLSIFVLLSDGRQKSERAQRKSVAESQEPRRQAAPECTESAAPEHPAQAAADLERNPVKEFSVEDVIPPETFTPFVAPKCEPGDVRYNSLNPTLAVVIPDYVVLDLETTGLNAQLEKIIEVAAIKVSDGKVVDTFHTLVNPEKSIPANITRLTGITNADVAAAPVAAIVIPQLYFFLDGLPIVAHNANFDISFLVSAFRLYGIDAHLGYVDTLPLVRNAYPGLPNYKLATLISELDLADSEQEHRALSDAQATDKLYQRCRKKQLSLMGKRDLSYCMAALAENYESDGNIEAAIKYYESAVSYDCDAIRPYQRLGILYRKARRFQDEIRICDKAIDMLIGTPGGKEKAENFRHRKETAQKKLMSDSAAEQKG